MTAEADAEMRALAGEELNAAKARLPEIERQVQLMLLPKDEADEKNAILELRAGTGGLEAALFAADLWRMYQRYAESHGWKFEPLSISETFEPSASETTWMIASQPPKAHLPLSTAGDPFT